MKMKNTFAAALVWVGALTITTFSEDAPKLKMTTAIPPEITTPDSVETRLGTLKFFDGFPDDATVEKVYDNLDFQRGMRPKPRAARRFSLNLILAQICSKPFAGWRHEKTT